MIQADPIIKQLKEQIAKFQPGVSVEKVGTVLEVGDGIARVAGLSQVASMEMLDFGNNIFGVALNLEAFANQVARTDKKRIPDERSCPILLG